MVGTAAMAAALAGCVSYAHLYGPDGALDEVAAARVGYERYWGRCGLCHTAFHPTAYPMAAWDSQIRKYGARCGLTREEQRFVRLYLDSHAPDGARRAQLAALGGEAPPADEPGIVRPDVVSVPTPAAAAAPTLPFAVPFHTPGLATLWPTLAPAVQASVRTAAAAAAPPAPMPAGAGFAPTGPDVSVHVARATHRWLAGAALAPAALDRFLADERNFFPDCTICYGVRQAMAHHRDAVAAAPPDDARRRWLDALRTALPTAPWADLEARQATSATLGPALRDAFAAYAREAIADPAARARLRDAAVRMDALTTAFARSGEAPAYGGLPGCALCAAAATGLAAGARHE